MARILCSLTPTSMQPSVACVLASAAPPPPSTIFEKDIVRRVFMALRTVGLQCVNGAWRTSPPNIFQVGDGFQMIGIDTISIRASSGFDVIYLKPFLNWTIRQEVGDSMNCEGIPVYQCSRIPSVSSTRPQPATIRARCLVYSFPESILLFTRKLRNRLHSHIRLQSDCRAGGVLAPLGTLICRPKLYLTVKANR